MSSRSPSMVSSAVRRMAAGFDLAAAPGELALRQRVVLEHALDRFQIELGGKIGDCEIFLVEAAGRLGLFGVVVDQVLEQSAKRGDVALEIHVQERGELQESRIHLAHRADVAHRNGRDELLLEPFDRLVGRQLVDHRRRDAAIDRARHQDHARRRRGMFVFRHDRHRRERRDARLADRHDVGTRPHDAEEVDDVLDVFVESEAARGQRHVARVVPVGDVDVVVGEHRLDGVAQERGEVSRHRRDDQHARAGFRHVLPEIAATSRRASRGRSPRAPRRRRSPTLTLSIRNGGRRCVSAARRNTSQAAAILRSARSPESVGRVRSSTGIAAVASARSAHIPSECA